MQSHTLFDHLFCAFSPCFILINLTEGIMEPWHRMIWRRSLKCLLPVESDSDMMEWEQKSKLKTHLGLKARYKTEIGTTSWQNLTLLTMVLQTTLPCSTTLSTPKIYRENYTGYPTMPQLEFSVSFRSLPVWLIWSCRLITIHRFRWLRFPRLERSFRWLLHLIRNCQLPR